MMTLWLPRLLLRACVRCFAGQKGAWPRVSIGLATILFFSLAQPVRADSPPPPAWASQTGAVHHVYLFPNASQTPLPDGGDNAFGLPSAQVFLGNFNTGWQDPDDPMAFYGASGSGAWDLGEGPAGAIRVTVPVGNAATGPGFEGYRIDLFVNVVCYTALFGMPTLAVDAHSLLGLSQSDTVAFPDPFFGNWYNRTWTCRVENVMEDTITLVISASASGAVIDSVELYALDIDGRSTFVTTQGIPVHWYQSRGILPLAGDDWSDVDHYDSDDDGMLNWQEYVAGTCATNPASLLKIVALRMEAGSSPVLEWIGGTNGPNADYIIESSPDLVEPDWQPVGTQVRSNGLHSWQDEVSVPARRLYRIRATLD